MHRATTTAPIPSSDLSSRKIVVMLGCYLAALLFVVTVAFLCWEWAKHDNPDAMVIVLAQKGVEGIRIQVIPVDPSAAAPLEATLTSRDGYRTRIHVAPGQYRVQIRRNDRLIQDRMIGLHDRESIVLPEISAPASQPAEPQP